MGTPLYLIDELRAIERAAQAQLAPGTLMARAGRAAAEWIAVRHTVPTSFCIVCGPGNNGGDGFVIATELRERGHDVLCVLPGSNPPTAEDARAAFGRWTAAGGRIHHEIPTDSCFGAVVDALFGIGLVRPLAGPHRDAVSWMNQQQSVYAIDVPSGLNSDTGVWVGDVPGVRATATITFIGDKPGLHTASGIDAAGIVTVDPIGTVAGSSDGMLSTTADLHAVLTPRRHDSHKGTYGNVAVVGGGRGMVGAVLLAGRAALRFGAGRVYVDAIGTPDLRVDPMQPELMFRSLRELTELQALVVGCGLGTGSEARSALASALECDAAVVLDADALNLVATDKDLKERVRQRSAATLLTPHPLEAARLLACGALEIQHDRIAAARRLSRDFDAITILKGAGSVIAGTDGRYAVNSTGSPALATAGTGDVLAGMLGALLAQGVTAWDAAVAAVWLHGRAADDAGDVGMVASDVAPRAAEILSRMRASPAALHTPAV
jgi:hydroxyethylthiazole kinase-like uncharacterized protein yjeF